MAKNPPRAVVMGEDGVFHALAGDVVLQDEIFVGQLALSFKCRRAVRGVGREMSTSCVSERRKFMGTPASSVTSTAMSWPARVPCGVTRGSMREASLTLAGMLARPRRPSGKRTRRRRLHTSGSRRT